MSSTNPTKEEMLAEIQALRTANSALVQKAAAKANRPITCKVSEKGAVSVYGLGRFPVTLYASQWRKLLGSVPEIQAFLDENKGKLAEKPATPEAAAAPAKVA